MGAGAGFGFAGAGFGFAGAGFALAFVGVGFAATGAVLTGFTFAVVVGFGSAAVWEDDRRGAGLGDGARPEHAHCEHAGGACEDDHDRKDPNGLADLLHPRFYRHRRPDRLAIPAGKRERAPSPAPSRSSGESGRYAQGVAPGVGSGVMLPDGPSL